MKNQGWLVALALVAVVITAACGNDGGMMTGPSAMGPGGGAVFMSVSPQGGATGVPTTAAITFRFGAAMGTGMERFVDLHVGDLTGPTVPMSCGWSGDRTVLTCTPQGALQPRMTYALHLGGGMMSQAGQPLDYGQYGGMMGGQWIAGGMMGASHGGGSWGMMGSGWSNSNGSYGMVFSFTTA